MLHMLNLALKAHSTYSKDGAKFITKTHPQDEQ